MIPGSAAPGSTPGRHRILLHTGPASILNGQAVPAGRRRGLRIAVTKEMTGSEIVPELSAVLPAVIRGQYFHNIFKSGGEFALAFVSHIRGDGRNAFFCTSQ